MNLSSFNFATSHIKGFPYAFNTCVYSILKILVSSALKVCKVQRKHYKRYIITQRHHEYIGRKSLHISGKLAILGFILFLAGIVWKLASGIPLGIWVNPPESLVAAWWAFTAIHIAGFFLFVVSLIYYLWKGRKAL
ncbi:hypothetical protein DRO69_03895 [Candidatus Bathyarchaeota archaeon]|nr:MAG: hypothetical protein DRO69_03895 [Candidatus Bathyarchaeota archaeon]